MRNLVVTDYGMVELQEKEHRLAFGDSKLKSYDVIYDGQKIGSVEGYYPTIEKKIPGKRYVAWRRKSRTVHWIPDYPGVRNRYRDYVETRKRAIETVVRNYVKSFELAVVAD
jgi:hypothetical protein